MEDQNVIKIVGICCLTAILVVNYLTMKIDSTLTGTICAIIGGLAGYSFGKTSIEKEIME
jgi:hypothetical protein